MQFDFDRITDRRNTGSLKWDAAEAELPMWVAAVSYTHLDVYKRQMHLLFIILYSLLTDGIVNGII